MLKKRALKKFARTIPGLSLCLIIFAPSAWAADNSFDEKELLQSKRYGKARVALEEGRLKEAVEQADLLLTENPSDEKALIIRGRANEGWKKLNQAARDLSRALELNPKSAIAYYWRAVTFYDMGQSDAAVRDIEQVMRLKPRSSDAYNVRALIRYNLQKDPSGCLNDFTEALKLRPDYQTGWNNRGAIYFQLGRYDEAKHDFDRALQLNPADYETLNSRGRNFQAMKKYDLAIKDFDRAIKLNPKKSTWFNNKALALSKLGRYQEAIDNYTQALKIEPNSFSTLANRGASYVRTKQYKLAEQDLLRALKINPKHANTHNNLAALYTYTGREGLAEAELDKAIQLDPSCGTSYYNRARIMEDQGQMEQAMADFQRAKETTTANKERGYDKNSFLDVIKHCTRFLTVNPRDKETYYNRGMAYFCIGEMKPALLDLEQFLNGADASAKSTVNAAILSNFAHRRLGQTDSARNDIARIQIPSTSPTYWPFHIVSYLRGKTTAEAVKNLKVNTRSKTGLRCFLAIDLLIQGKQEEASSLLHWIKDFGDRNIDEFDLAMAELSRLKSK